MQEKYLAMPLQTPIPLAIADIHVKFFARELAAIGVSAVAFITAWQEQAIFWAQFLAYALGALASAYALYGIWKKRRDSKVTALQRALLRGQKRIMSKLDDNK